MGRDERASALYIQKGALDPVRAHGLGGSIYVLVVEVACRRAVSLLTRVSRAMIYKKYLSQKFQSVSINFLMHKNKKVAARAGPCCILAWCVAARVALPACELHTSWLLAVGCRGPFGSWQLLWRWLHGAHMQLARGGHGALALGVRRCAVRILAIIRCKILVLHAPRCKG